MTEGALVRLSAEAKLTVPSAVTARTARTGRKQRIEAYSLLVLLGIIWGMAFVALKVMETYLSPVNMTLLRWLIACAAFIALAPVAGRLKTRFNIRDLPRFLIVAFTLVVCYNLALNFSEKIISAGLAGLLVALGPVFLIILSYVFTGEERRREVVLAMVLAFSGALILSFGAEGGGSDSIIGVMEAVGSALSFAVYALLSKPLVTKYGARPLTIWTGIAGTAMLLPLLSSSFFSHVQAMPPAGWMAILYLSLLSSVVGYMLFYMLLDRGLISRLSIQLYLVPVVSVIGGTVLLSEPVTVYTIGGGGMLLSAIALTSRKRK